MHLIIDGYSSDRQLLQDETSIYQILDSFPGHIGMTKISGPFIYRYTAGKPEDWGISGLVLIAESHISIHTFVERNFVNIDVFSCIDFDTDSAIDYLIKLFSLTSYRTYLLDRSYQTLPEGKCLKEVKVAP